MKYFLFIVFFFLMSLASFSQVINAGVGGNNTSQLLKRIDKDVIDQHPDLTIVMVGTNDLLNSRKMISYAEYAENLTLIVKKTKG